MAKSRFRIIAFRSITPNGIDEETIARVKSIITLARVWRVAQ